MLINLQKADWNEILSKIKNYWSIKDFYWIIEMKSSENSRIKDEVTKSLKVTDRKY